ncbi:MAG TPA: LuxR C-terminal-related transcriptional regulator [Candidatus Saccharimonadales bacterium]|nr:LuxR C-terminal-related transcriptional regulator [Candidatus Saccharimonadales bacterium]
MKLAYETVHPPIQVLTDNGNLALDPIRQVQFFDGAFAVESQRPRRQMSSLALRAVGLSNRQISDLTGVEEKTVKNILYDTYKALGAATCPQAIGYSFDNGDLVVVKAATPVDLSPGELRVLECTRQGQNADEIANSLGLAPKTVKNIRAGMVLKINGGEPGAIGIENMTLLGILSGVLPILPTTPGEMEANGQTSLS